MKDEPSDPDLIEGYSVKELLGSFSGLKNPAPDDSTRRWEGMTLGSYELLEEIDRGGMGIVFKARQRTLDRIVAVKVLRSGGFAGEDELARFQAEAHALGQLEHPHIIPIYDVGEENGQPFLAMKFIEGGCLLGQVDRFVANPRAAVEVMIKVATAVHEAHRRGILHRDLKPANILIDGQDEPHVTDFGLARRVGAQSSLTVTGAVMGSPNYISPEVALSEEDAITTAADVYGLGAVMFHLITGRPPFEGDNPVLVLKAVTETDPSAPSTLNRKVDHDLGTICLKCIERDPQRRYPSAFALVADLERWTRNEPIEARPAATHERLAKWAQRHPVLTLLVVLLGLATIGFVAMDRVYQDNLRLSRDRALEREKQAQRANRQLEAAVIDLQLERAEQEFAAGRQRQGMQHLLTILDNNPTHRVATERLEHEWNRRRFALQAAEALVPICPAQLLAVSSDGEAMAGAGAGLVHVWSVDDRDSLMPSFHWSVPFIALGLNADSSKLMVASANEARIYAVPSSKPVLTWKDPNGSIQDAKLDAAGDRLYVASNAQVVVIDAQSGTELQRFARGGKINGNGLALSPSGHLLVIARGNRMAWRDLQSGELLNETQSNKFVSHMAFSGNGSRLVVAFGENWHQFWNSSTREPLDDPVKHRTVLRHVALDHTGRNCALGFVAGRITVFEVDSGLPVLDPIRESGDLTAMTFRPGQEVLVTSSTRGPIRYWDLKVPGTFEAPPKEYISTYTAFDRTGNLRLQRNQNSEGHFSSRGNRIQLPYDDNESVWHFAVSPDRTTIATVVIQQGTARVDLLDAKSLEVERTLLSKRENLFVHFSPDGLSLLITADGNGLVIWDLREGKIRLDNPEFPGVRLIAFGPNGNWFVTSDRWGKIEKWSVETGDNLAVLNHHETRAGALAVKPDGKMLLTGHLDGQVCWWDLEENKASLRGTARFSRKANWVSFSPRGGEMFLAGSRDGSFRVWDTATKDLLCRVEAHELPLTQAAFTTDGRHVRTISMEARARIWDARSGYPVTSPLRHDEWWEVPQGSLVLDRKNLEEIARHSRPVGEPSEPAPPSSPSSAL